MAEDEIPKLADWLAEYRSRPEPREVIVASYDLTQPIPDDSAHGMSEGQTGIEIVTYDLTDWPGPADNSHYVMGVDGDGQNTSGTTGTSLRTLREKPSRAASTATWSSASAIPADRRSPMSNPPP
jgi:hypothetical protein